MPATARPPISFAVVHGSATRLAVLEEAGVRAEAIIVAPDARPEDRRGHVSIGTGLDIIERVAGPEGDGRTLGEMSGDAPVIGVVRGDRLLRFDEPEAHVVRACDELVCFCSDMEAA